MNDLYVYHKGRKLRCGYTTGSCATAAAKAAAYMLQHQERVDAIEIDLPQGGALTLSVANASYGKTEACCSVIKDAGDDQDATDGMEISAQVKKRSDGQVQICGGQGIGTITKAGFWGNPGEHAINPVPRQMIKDALSAIDSSGWDVEISAPEGEQIAQKTLNARLGIVNGISIIGTTGIVEPMSNEALKQTIYLEIDDIHKNGHQEILLFLGNYGETVARDLEIDLPAVKISNFIGDAVLYCKNKVFKRVVLIGHIGKISKLSIGAFNTHSSVCDLRLEAFVYYLALSGAPRELMEQVTQCTDSEEALSLILEKGYQQIPGAMKNGSIKRIQQYVNDPAFNVEVILYSMKTGILD